MNSRRLKMVLLGVLLGVTLALPGPVQADDEVTASPAPHMPPYQPCLTVEDCQALAWTIYVKQQSCERAGRSLRTIADNRRSLIGRKNARIQMLVTQRRQRVVRYDRQVTHLRAVIQNLRSR